MALSLIASCNNNKGISENDENLYQINFMVWKVVLELNLRASDCRVLFSYKFPINLVGLTEHCQVALSLCKQRHNVKLKKSFKIQVVQFYISFVLHCLLLSWFRNKNVFKIKIKDLLPKKSRQLYKQLYKVNDDQYSYISYKRVIFENIL